MYMRAAALAMLAVLPATTRAQAVFEIIGAAGPEFPTYASLLSGDGQVIAGTIRQPGNPGNRLFRWNAQQGFEVGGSSEPHDWHLVTAISADGTVIAGFTDTAAAYWSSFRWSTTFDRPAMPIPGEHLAMDMSRDGSAIVGYLTNGVTWSEAYIWNQSGVSLPFANTYPLLPSSRFNAISGDGTALFGFYLGERFRLHAVHGYQALPAPAPAEEFRASADGSVLAGYANIPGQFTSTPARWTSGGFSAPQLLDPLRRIGRASGVSADGARIVGFTVDGPFIWDPVIGLQDLVPWLISQGAQVPPDVAFQSSPGNWQGYIAISDDGAHLAGTLFASAGPSAQVWYASVPPFCYANCDGSSTPPILNIADFGCFLQKFAAADPYANCDASAVSPVLNVADFACFLQKFAAGCH